MQTVVRTKQTLNNPGALQAVVDASIKQSQKTIRKIDQALKTQARRLGCGAQVRRCQGIPGVGPLTALAMVATGHRGRFPNDDAFIAFMGMDVRARVGSVSWSARAVQKG